MQWFPLLLISGFFSLWFSVILLLFKKGKFILLYIFLASWICVLMSDINWGKFLVLNYLNISWVLCLFLLSLKYPLWICYIFCIVPDSLILCYFSELFSLLFRLCGIYWDILKHNDFFFASSYVYFNNQEIKCSLHFHYKFLICSFVFGSFLGFTSLFLLCFYFAYPLLHVILSSTVYQSHIFYILCQIIMTFISYSGAYSVFSNCMTCNYYYFFLSQSWCIGSK